MRPPFLCRPPHSGRQGSVSLPLRRKRATTPCGHAGPAAWAGDDGRARDPVEPVGGWGPGEVSKQPHLLQSSSYHGGRVVLAYEYSTVPRRRRFISVPQRLGPAQAGGIKATARQGPLVCFAGPFDSPGCPVLRPAARRKKTRDRRISGAAVQAPRRPAGFAGGAERDPPVPSPMAALRQARCFRLQGFARVVRSPLRPVLPPYPYPCTPAHVTAKAHGRAALVPPVGFAWAPTAHRAPTIRLGGKTRGRSAREREERRPLA